MLARRVVLSGLALLALAAACGGGGGDRLTKQEFVVAANAICKAANDRLDTLPDPTSLRDVASMVEQAVPIEEDAIAKLAALEPPAADQSTIDEVLDLLRQQVDVARRLGAAAQAGDQARATDLAQQMRALSDRADRIAADYGAVECENN